MAILSLAFCYILTILKTFMDDRYQTGPVDFQWLKLPMPIGFEVLQIEPIKSFGVLPNNFQKILSIKCRIHWCKTCKSNGSSLRKNINCLKNVTLKVFQWLHKKKWWKNYNLLSFLFWWYVIRAKKNNLPNNVQSLNGKYRRRNTAFLNDDFNLKFEHSALD